MSSFVCSDAYSDLIWVMKVTSTMPYKKANLQQKIRATILWVLFLGVLTTFIMEIFVSFDDAEYLSEVTYFFLEYFSTIVKKYTYTKSDQLIRIFEMLDTAEFNNEKEIIRKPLIICVIRAKKLIKSFLVVMLAVVSVYAIFPVFGINPVSINFSYNIGHYTSYVRWFQVVGVAIAGISMIGMDTLCAVLLMIAAAQVDILRLKLIGNNGDNTGENDPEEDQFERDGEIQKNLKECIRLHLYIIDYVAELEKLYSAPLLSQYLTNMAILCLVMMQIMFMAQFPSIRYLLLVLIIIGLSFRLVLYHYFGNELVMKSSKIVEACYSSEWYYYDPKARKMLLIIMERAKRPLYLTIYGFDMVTMSSFLKIYKSSYSIFAVLRSIYKD